MTLSSIDNLKDEGETLIIGEVLSEVIKNYEVQARAKNIEIKNNITDEKIFIGKTALRIVLSNLLSNAVKYTDECGSISIGSEENVFYMENTYENKSAIDIEKIFDVNFDLQKKNSNGLGLYIVANLLKNYDIKYGASQSNSKFRFEIKL